MKKVLMMISVALYATAIFSQSPSVMSEEEAIKQALTKETASFWSADYEGWANSYVHEPYLVSTLTNGGDPGDVMTFWGWEALDNTVSQWIKGMLAAPADKRPKYNGKIDKWNIQIRGNMAYVTYNHHFEDNVTKMDVIEQRVVEKINGAWKIVMSSTLADFKDATPPMRSKY